MIAPGHIAVVELALEPWSLDDAQVLAGRPAVAGKVLWRSTDGAQECGVWEITECVVTDVEEDELFVVVRGRATVVVENGPTLELGPGDLGSLSRGDRTTWSVHETLRKVYMITPGGA